MLCFLLIDTFSVASESGADSNENDEKSEIDDLPFACFICRGDFVNPVITKYVSFFDVYIVGIFVLLFYLSRVFSSFDGYMYARVYL